MCPKIKTLECRPNCGRYDDKTYKAQNFFLDKGYVRKKKWKILYNNQKNIQPNRNI